MNKKRLVVFLVSVIAILGIVGVSTKPAIDNMNLGLDLKGGFEILYEVSPLEGSETKDVDMAAVASSVSKRVNVLGVSEPDITVEGNRIRVQLAGVKDNEQARDVISSSAVLSFRDTSDNLLMDATVLKDGGASLGFNEGKAIVNLKIADTAKFYEVTSALSKTTDKLMVTWLDYQEGQRYAEEANKAATEDGPAYISAATVSEGLNSETVMISGNFTEDEAQELVDLLNSGSLNFQMKEIYSNVVSPNLGVGAFESTMLAGGIGILAIAVLLMVLYRLCGFISAISVAIYLVSTLALYTLLGGVFTLSGIAALVLGVGMAVDSSVITFERIKDSLYAGRSVKNAFKEGSHNSLSTILDSQITTMIAALILYIFGTGSVKGFATMLLISTILAVVFNVTLVRFLLGQVVKSGYLDNKKSWFGIKENYIPNVQKGEKYEDHSPWKNFDFVGKAKYFIAISVTIMIIGVGTMGFNGIKGDGIFNFGIDFSSGSRITMESKTTLKADTLQKEFEKLGVEPSDITLSGEKNEVASVTIKKAITEEQREKITDYMNETYKDVEVSDSTVSPVVGRELVKNAIIMSILSWVAILIYVSIRFKWDFAVSGIAALVHDVFVILAVFAFTRMEITTDIIAVLLTIIGYSINDSIVIFDRMRDNLKGYGRKQPSQEQLRDIVNVSLRETFGRSIVTASTTILPVVALLLFGSRNIFQFNIALLVGLIGGCISSLFIAPQLWYVLRLKFKVKHKAKKKPKKLKGPQEHIIPGVND